MAYFDLSIELGDGEGRIYSVFVLKISLSDHRCVLGREHALSNSHPQQRSSYSKVGDELPVTGSVNKQTGHPTAREFWWDVEREDYFETHFSPPMLASKQIQNLTTSYHLQCCHPGVKLPSFLVLFILIASYLDPCLHRYSLDSAQQLERSVRT